MPEQSRLYEAVPKMMMVGTINVITYEDIVYGRRGEKDELMFDDATSRLAKQKAKEKKDYEFAELLPIVMSFIPLCQVCYSSKVSRSWNYGVSLYKYYTDVRDSTPWNVVRPHTGAVDSVTAITDHSSGVLLVVSTGDRRIMITNGSTGEQLCCVARDTGSIPGTLYHISELYCASSNGSIRSFIIPHDLKRIAPVRHLLVSSTAV